MIGLYNKSQAPSEEKSAASSVARGRVIIPTQSEEDKGHATSAPEEYLLGGGLGSGFNGDPGLFSEEKIAAAFGRTDPRRSSMNAADGERRLREELEQENLIQRAMGRMPTTVVQRTIASKEFDRTLYKLDWKNYSNHRKQIDVYLKQHGIASGVSVNLFASLSEELQLVLLNDSVKRYKKSPDAMVIFPYNVGTMEDFWQLSFDQIDALIRWNMKPANKTHFLRIIKEHCKMELPDGCKAGPLNFPVQFRAFQVFIEKFKKYLIWLGFDETPIFAEIARHKTKGFYPEVDNPKGKGIVQLLRELVPSPMKEHFFTILPRPPGNDKAWTNPHKMIEEFEELWYTANITYNEHIVPFVSMYDQGAISLDGGGSLRTLSQVFPSGDNLDGDPFLYTTEEIQQVREDAVLAAMQTSGQQVHKTKPELLPCFKTIFSKSKICPNKDICKFSHDPILLREKVRTMMSDLKHSPYYSSLAEAEEENEDEI